MIISFAGARAALAAKLLAATLNGGLGMLESGRVAEIDTPGFLYTVLTTADDSADIAIRIGDGPICRYVELAIEAIREQAK